MAVDADDEVPRVQRFGEYEVLVEDKAVAFWPLDPYAVPATATPALLCAPGTAQSINTVVLPTFGVFDIIIRATDDAVLDEIDAPDLAAEVAGKATIKKMPLIQGEDGAAHIRFAVDHSKVAEQGFWAGKLRLRGSYKSGSTTKTCTAELKLQIEREGTRKDLFVFFVVHKRPAKSYAWATAKVVDTDGAPCAGVTADLKILRDNLPATGFANLNRRTRLVTSSSGQLIEREERRVLGLPSEWPMILTLESPAHVTRAHLCRLSTEDAKNHNGSPRELGSIRLTARQKASLAGRKIVLDPGHGVVYALLAARRSQEWFVAHRLADRIAEVLRSEHGVAAQDIRWTRTAGLGLIEPTQVHNAAAPETGEHRYQIDLPKKQIAIKQSALGLGDLATLLLTRHNGDADTVVEVTEEQRNDFLARHQKTIDAVLTALDHKLAKTKERVLPGSLQWSTKKSQYIYTQEKKLKDGTWATSKAEVPLPIKTTDWFALDADDLAVLTDRTARWSLECEIGFGPAASGSRPDFRKAARASMREAGALDYIRGKISTYLDVTDPHPYLSHGAKAWGPTTRLKYINDQTDADLVLSLHENADGGKGGMILVSQKSGGDAPTADQVRIGKVFLKYLDGFDRGLRQGGLTKAEPANPAMMLYGGNHMRDRYAYFESEFMDALVPNDSSKYTYSEMCDERFIDRVARQIVCGIVEWLLECQADLDSVTYNKSNQIAGLW